MGTEDRMIKHSVATYATVAVAVRMDIESHRHVALLQPRNDIGTSPMQLAWGLQAN